MIFFSTFFPCSFSSSFLLRFNLFLLLLPDADYQYDADDDHNDANYDDDDNDDDDDKDLEAKKNAVILPKKKGYSLPPVRRI